MEANPMPAAISESETHREAARRLTLLARAEAAKPIGQRDSLRRLKLRIAARERQAFARRCAR
jgi:hypothetical protein